MWYCIWVLTAIIFYSFIAIFSKWANDDPNTWRWVITLYVMGFFSLWPLVAKYSKNLVFDGLLYDLLIFTTFYGVIFLMGAGKDFNTVQWMACVMIMAGFVILKLGG